MTDIDRLKEHALGKPGAWPDQPWGDEVVAKVHEKIFCFFGDAGIGVKAGADRDEADEWLQRYPEDASVMPYIGRSGWNNLAVGAAIPFDELVEALDESYLRVVERLPKKHRPDGWDN